MKQEAGCDELKYHFVMKKVTKEGNVSDSIVAQMSQTARSSQAVDTLIQ
jgi:hypothetical protein